MRQLFFIFVLCLSNQVIAQKNINIDFSTGTLLVKSNPGYNLEAGMSYDISQRTAVYGNYNYSEINIINDNKNSVLHRIQFGGYYSLLNNSTQISSVSGFSVLFSGDNSIIDRTTTLALDLGVLTLVNEEKKFSYGFKLINTFSPSSIGGIMQASMCFRVKL